MPRRHLFLRIVLAYVCAGHIVTALLALLANDWAIRVGSLLYGASFDPTDQFRYIIKPLGAFELGLGLLQAMAVRDPWRYRAVIDVTLVVLALRLFQRVIFASDISATFHIPASRHWLNTTHFVVVALLLVAVRVMLGTESGAPGAERLAGGRA